MALLLCVPLAPTTIDAEAGEGGAPGPGDPRLAGGAATVFETDRYAYSRPIPELAPDDAALFASGRELFYGGWRPAPAPGAPREGLGPTFIRDRCSGCHLRNGRGWPPEFEYEEMYSMLVRLSVPGTDAHGGPKPHPVYGREIQNHAITGVPAEGHPFVRREEVEGVYGDGWPYRLGRPSYVFSDLTLGPLGPDVMLSARVALPVFGLGLLEAVPEATILARVDPLDRDGDGVSGRANRVWDAVAGAPALGRFGWKAGVATLRQQAAAAALRDIGITNPVFARENCAPSQYACRLAPAGRRPEMSAAMLDRLVFYLRAIAVPARRALDDPRVVRGEALFAAAGCAACHLPTLVTGDEAPLPGLAGQVIHPYSDLLLHDMGEGLADHRPEYLAGGREWRTPPLWGIGLLATVTFRRFLLHDGRARGFAEAILWHGGEAEAAREAFRTLPTADRAALIAFLGSL